LVADEQFSDIEIVCCAEGTICQGCIVTQYPHVPGMVHIDADV